MPSSQAAHIALSDLPRGQKAVITGIDEGNEIYLRLHEMGFDEGINIEVIQIGPFGGDPLAVNVDGVVIALRRSEAAKVRVSITS